MFVGGEFYYDPTWLRAAGAAGISTENSYFLNGGAACLTVIGDFLLDHGIARVLLPSYLCPSICKTFERSGIGWDFYQVNGNLSIDVEDLARKAGRFQAVYYINYFGFFHPPEIQALFSHMQDDQKLVIEDNAQAGFPGRPLGDFTFNSLRKLAPYDGGYLVTRQDMAPYIDKYRGLPNRRLPLIRAYRQKLYPYLHDHAGSYDELTSLFHRATGYYETDTVVAGDEGERAQIERLDWAGIRQIRRENYRYLMEWVASIPEIQPIYPALQDDNMPFGLPVYFAGADRDRVNEALGNAGIGLIIHWEDILTDPHTRQNRLAAHMASNMLTLVIDQRTTHKQMDYLAMNLIQAIATLNAS